MQARELKSVYLKAKGSFLKLLMHKCYLNPLNLFSQVGLIAINVLGQPANMGQPGAPLGLRGAARLVLCKDQQQCVPAIHLVSNNNELVCAFHVCRVPSGPSGAGINDLAVDMGMDADTAAMLREVALRKEAAVAGEDFELAKRLKALQDQIKHVGGTLAALTADKARAVEQEDYDTAARLKDEIGRIRGVILSQMGDLGIRPPPRVQMGQAPHYAPPMHQYQQQQQQPALLAPPPGYDRGYPSDGGSGNGGGPTLRESIAQGGGMPGSVDRPIRPAAAGSDIYARAAGTPERVNAGEAFGGRRGSGAGITSPGGLRQQLAASFDAQGRPVSRQIRPARDDNVEAKLQEENARRGDGGGGSGKESDSSPFTKRPGGGGGEERPDASQLAGVEGAGDLPAPDSLPTALEKEAQPVTDLFGGQSDYVARCLYSRAWSLREAAVLKIAHDVEAGWPMERHGRGKGEVLATCAGGCRTRGVRDDVVLRCACIDCCIRMPLTHTINHCILSFATSPGCRCAVLVHHQGPHRERVHRVRLQAAARHAHVAGQGARRRQKAGARHDVGAGHCGWVGTPIHKAVMYHGAVLTSTPSIAAPSLSCPNSHHYLCWCPRSHHYCYWWCSAGGQDGRQHA